MTHWICALKDLAAAGGRAHTKAVAGLADQNARNVLRDRGFAKTEGRGRGSGFVWVITDRGREVLEGRVECALREKEGRPRLRATWLKALPKPEQMEGAWNESRI